MKISEMFELFANNLLQNWKRYLYGMWLGGSLSIVYDARVTEPGFWLVLLPTVALMAQLCLGVLLGLPGVLLALPLVVVLQVLCQRVLVEQVMDRWT